MCEGDKDALLALPFYVLLLCCLSFYDVQCMAVATLSRVLRHRL